MRRLASILVAVVVAGVAAAACTPVKSPGTVTVPFFCVGYGVGWHVPAGVTQLTIDVFGAEGGSVFDHLNREWAGGAGGRATATVAVTPGELLGFNVGCRGQPGDVGVAGEGGFPGGGDGGTSSPTNYVGASGGGGGGGWSDVIQGSTRILAAGSGGGAGFEVVGGAGGGEVGGDGGAPSGLPQRAGEGANGSLSGLGGDPGGWPGGAGWSPAPGGDGGDHSGVPSRGDGGGGGGAGYAGGGGGGFNAASAPGGGGGGSAFGPPGTLFETGVHSGDGIIVVRYTAP